MNASDHLDPVIVSMATIPRRIHLLRKVVRRLLPQCDRLNVYLNGHHVVPDFLQNEQIEVVLSREHGDLGDAGKFWWSDKLDFAAYYFTVDDDILYPSDYCRRLVYKIEQMDRRAVVGMHGVMLPSKVGMDYYRDRRVYPYSSALKRSRAVHLLGTGTVAYHTSTLRVRPTDFHRRNMADIWFGLLAKHQRVPMICVNRQKGWLVGLPDPNPNQTIAATQHRHTAIQAAALRSAKLWSLPLTLPGIERGNMKQKRRMGAGSAHQLVRAHPHDGREFGAHKKETERNDRIGNAKNSGVRIKR